MDSVEPWLRPAAIVLSGTSFAALGAASIDHRALVELIFPTLFLADGTQRRSWSSTIFSTGFAFLCCASRFVRSELMAARVPRLSVDGMAASLLLVRAVCGCIKAGEFVLPHTVLHPHEHACMFSYLSHNAFSDSRGLRLRLRAGKRTTKAGAYYSTESCDMFALQSHLSSPSSSSSFLQSILSACFYSLLVSQCCARVQCRPSG